MKVIVVKVDGVSQIKDIEDDLATMQDIVEGYIELVRIAPDVMMVVNEEGLYRKTINQVASAFYLGGQINGNVFFAGRDDNNINSGMTSLNPTQIDWITRMISFNEGTWLAEGVEA